MHSKLHLLYHVFDVETGVTHRLHKAADLRPAVGQIAQVVNATKEALEILKPVLVSLSARYKRVSKRQHEGVSI